MKSELSLTLATFAAALSLQANSLTYNGNGDTGFGGAVGTGSVTVSDVGSTLSFTLNRGSGNLNDALVIYIDSVSGGFSSTAGFNDTADGGRSAISGVGGAGRSTLTFASGFLPDYAISIENGYASLFQLANGDNNSLTWLTGASQSGSANSATYSVSFDLSQIGLTAGAGQTIELFGTYTAASGWRSTEAVLGNDSGTQGVNPFTQTGFAPYTLSVVPEPSVFALSVMGLLMLSLKRQH